MAESNENKKRKINEFDWFEHGEAIPIARHFIHRSIPFAWTANSIHAAHGLTRGADDVNTRLWHVPGMDTPPKPNFVDFICCCASAKLKQNELGGDRGGGGGGHHHVNIDKGGRSEVKEYESTILKDDDDDDGKDSMSENGSSNDDDHVGDDDYDDDDSTYRELMQEKKMRKDPYMVKAWKGNKEENDAHKHECKLMQQTCDETAAVALAIISEECMISSLLPFAREHVAYCRRSDLVPPPRRKIRPNQPCSKWIIPVDEAIVDLGINKIGPGAGDVGDTSIPSSRYPQLVIKMVDDSLDYLPTLDELLDGKNTNELSAQKRERTEHYCMKQFCKNNDFDLDFVSNNSDLFRPILGCRCVNTAHQTKDRGKIGRIMDHLEASIEGREVDSEFPIPKIIVSKKRYS